LEDSFCFTHARDRKNMDLAYEVANRCRQLLGESRVEYPLQGERWLKGTDSARKSCFGRLTVHREDEVVGILKICSELGMPVFPFSTGNNWGYGTTSASSNGGFLLDLSTMKAIDAKNADLGVFSLEPGVTQKDLSDYLVSRKLDFLAPTTGAGPNCSILGNALERGYGITPMIDHFASVMSLRAVLPDGQIFESSLSAIGANRVAGLFKWGYGPYLDGIFTQGNYGVVTRMCVALARRPKTIRMISFSSPNSRDADTERTFVELVNKTREIIESFPGIIGSINLINDRRALAMTAPYPDKDAKRVLTTIEVKNLAEEYLISPWTGVGSIYGETAVVRAAEKEIRKRLKGSVRRLLFISERTISTINFVGRFMPKQVAQPIARVARALENGLAIMNGKPNLVAHAAAYWALRKPFDPDKHLNPAENGIGLLWYVPLLPARGIEVNEFVHAVTRICTENGIEPLITLTALSERCFDGSIPILYERDDPDACERAHRCFDQLLAHGLRNGIAPYRFSPHINNVMFPTEAGFTRLGLEIKSSIDPSGLISPGRYARNAMLAPGEL
jgi:4-cresol dehydrogenase (hydroxylating) flavoprotein subunit